VISDTLVVLAHGIVGRRDLPIPDELIVLGSAVVLGISFLALALLWQRPHLQDPRQRRVGAIGPVAAQVIDVVFGLIGGALFVAVVYAGFAGAQVATANPVPTFLFVLVWVGFAFASPVLGDVFGLLNPWRAAGRAIGWTAKRMLGDGMPEPLAYPARLGRWPAALGLLVFAWVELVYDGRDDPSTLAVLMLAYAALQLVGMSLFGVRAWSEKGDALGVWFNLLSRLSPWERRDGVLYLRIPLSGIFKWPPAAGSVALLTVMIGTTAFDGFSQGRVFNDFIPDLQRWIGDIGFSLDTALQISFTLTMLACWGAIAGIYWIGVLGMRNIDRERSAGELAMRYVGSLTPIALAYAVAHYFSLLAYQGQATLFLISDPLGDGSDLFGTAGTQIDYNWISATGIAWVQIIVLVVGHAAGLALAHDRAVADYEDVRQATLSQVWMLLVMIGFTCLGLWLLSSANQ
jgi:hypothetical protein